MDLRDFLSRLKGVKAQNGGEYICKCPAHDDRTASLCVKDGDKGIVIKCQAGCSTDAVLASMGLKMSDLFRAPLPAEKSRRAGRSSKVPASAAPPAEAASTPPKKKNALEFVCAYDYCDESGTLLFQACRYMDPDSGKKTFRLRQPDANARGGWKYNRKGARLVLYRLPQVLEAIREGKPIYIVEGEKDADNLAKLGLTATTNAMGAGKWLEVYGESLAGAKDVYIIPDNDDVGREHGMTVARSIVQRAKTVKILDLTKAYPDLPTKGDITDFYKLLGRKDADSALARLIAETAPYDVDERSEYEKAVDAYNHLLGYCIDNGRICQGAPDGAKPLGDFIALPRTVIVNDDGVAITKTLVIDGWRSDGQPLSRVYVRAEDYAAMTWVTKHWDFNANIMPGNAARERLRYAIGAVGQNTAARIMEYGHTGWRKIGGKWAFLYQGGAIGVEGVTVNLGNGLERYRLDGSGAEGFEQIPYAEAAGASLQFRDVMPERVAVPLLGTIFLAPLREFLQHTGADPAFSLFLLGSTSARKSTIAALALSHFGNFTYKSLPSNFHDTSNSIRRKAFLLKDVPIVVDDYHPSKNLQERKAMEQTAQALSRAFGDNADRGRMDSNMSLRPPMPPRGLAILSGEDLPDIGQSGLARYYIVNIGKTDIPTEGENSVAEILTEMQELASKGTMARCMQGYIKWLLPQAEELPDRLHDMFLAYRRRAAQMVRSQHGRAPDAVAHIMIGYDMMLVYMRDIGLLSTEECRQESERAWEMAAANSQQQTDELQDERPSRLFLQTIEELLVSRAAGVRDLCTVGAETPREMIGYSDAMYYYLLPNAAYRAVAKMCADQGHAFPLTMRMLYKQLREDGVLSADNGAATRVKRIDGRTQRLLWIPRSEIDGRKEIREQTRMNFAGEDAFIETDEPMPPGFEDGK